MNEKRVITYPGVKPNTYCIKSCGEIYNIKNGRLIKGYVDGKGYIRVGLQSTKPNGNRIDIGVHRLVCWEFNGPYEGDKDLVNHIDGCKHNNNFYNLEWCDNSTNVRHAISTGLLKINRQYDYDEQTISIACDLILLGLTNMEITEYIYNGLDIHSEEHGNFITTLGCIRAGKSYQNIFNERKYMFNKDDYNDLNLDDIRESLKLTRTNITDYDTRNMIKEYQNNGYSKIDILELITGYRSSSATVYTKRIYKMINDIFK